MRNMAKIKEMTSQEKELKALKSKQRALFAAEAGCATVIPIGLTTLFNFNDIITKVEVWRISLTFIMAAFMTLISVAVLAKDKFKINLGGALATFVVVDIWLFIMGDIITKLAWIFLYVTAGFLSAFVIECGKNKKVKRIKELEEGINKGKTNIIAEGYQEEIKKIKVKIK